MIIYTCHVFCKAHAVPKGEASQSAFKSPILLLLSLLSLALLSLAAAAAAAADATASRSLLALRSRSAPALTAAVSAVLSVDRAGVSYDF
jgi:hypothetical protein